MRKKADFSLPDARAEVLDKIARKTAAGVPSPVTAATKEPKRSHYVQALAELEAERAIFVDRSAARPKYFLIEYAPNAETAAVKMEQAAALKHPALRKATDLKKALSRLEHSLFAEALALLESTRRLVRLTHGKSLLFAHGDSLRALLGEGPRAERPVSEDEIRAAYTELVRRTGFPEVEIAALQRASGLPLAGLKSWLLAEHAAGRANFSLGDWSLADDATRAAVIELRGERHLLVRLSAAP